MSRDFTIWIPDIHTVRYSGVQYSDGYCSEQVKVCYSGFRCFTHSDVCFTDCHCILLLKVIPYIPSLLVWCWCIWPNNNFFYLDKQLLRQTETSFLADPFFYLVGLFTTGDSHFERNKTKSHRNLQKNLWKSIIDENVQFWNGSHAVLL